MYDLRLGCQTCSRALNGGAMFDGFWMFLKDPTNQAVPAKGSRRLPVSIQTIAGYGSFLGSLAEAERAFRMALKAATEKGDARELSVSHNKIGDVQRAQGNLPAALTSYQTSHAIRDRLAQSDPGTAGWQGNLPAALTSYQASHAIRDRLAQSDPGNAGWQRDLASSFGRVAMIDVQRGARDEALGAFQQGRDIIARLARQSPENGTLPNDLAWFDNQIAAKSN
jgi:hypothetical protein